MSPLNVFAEIKYYTGKEVKYQWEAHCQERGVNKKQAYFGDRDIKAFTEVSTNAERVSFKKGDYPLQHIKPFLVFYFQRRIAGISYNRSNYFLIPTRPANQMRY
jgi:hypothetical protein